MTEPKWIVRLASGEVKEYGDTYDPSVDIHNRVVYMVSLRNTTLPTLAHAFDEIASLELVTPHQSITTYRARLEGGCNGHG
jgi:hypothetical protein